MLIDKLYLNDLQNIIDKENYQYFPNFFNTLFKFSELVCFYL